ncbi:MAG: hypothetical protein QXF01_01905 [Candidatus Micrarchaeaceae archaeon]
MNRSQARHLLTRISLAVVFVGIGIWEIAQPSYWGMFVPPFLAWLIATNLFVVIHGFALLAVGIAVLFGAYLRFSSAVAALIMLSIVVSLAYYFGFTDILIRDLAILFISLALFFDDTDYLRATKAR